MEALPKGFEIIEARKELLNLYLNDPEFRHGMEDMWKEYKSTINEMLTDNSIGYHGSEEENTYLGEIKKSYPEFYTLTCWIRIFELLDNSDAPITEKIKSGLSQVAYSLKLIEMMSKLRSLALRYHFDYYWVVTMLLIQLMNRLIAETDVEGNKEEVAQALANYVGYSICNMWPEIPPLKIPAGLILSFTSDEVINRVIRKLIAEFKKNLQEKGIEKGQTNPRTDEAMRKHIGWLYRKKRFGQSPMVIYKNENKILANDAKDYSDYTYVADMIKLWDEKLNQE